MLSPSIIFVPGSYSLISEYKEILDALKETGYEVVAIYLPTIGLSSGKGRDTPPASMYDDAAAVAEAAERLIVGEGKNVMIVGHSYAGIPMSQSTKGLGKVEREARGERGGIVRLAILAGLVPPVGESAASLLQSLPKEKAPPVAVDVSYHCPLSSHMANMCNFEDRG